MKDQKLNERLIAYLDGELSSVDAEAFEQEMKQSDLLQSQYALLTLVNDAATMDADNAIRFKMKGWERELDATTAQDYPRRRLHWAWLLALAALLGGLSYFAFDALRAADDTPEFMAYYTVPTAEIYRTGEQEPQGQGVKRYQQALQDHLAGRYDQAIEGFMSVPSGSPFYDQSRLLVVDAHIQDSAYLTALEQIHTFEQDVQLSEQGQLRLQFTKALLLLQIGREKEARSVLESIMNTKGHPFGAKASKVMKDLNSG